MAKAKRNKRVDASTLDPFNLAFIFRNMQCTEPTNTPLASWCIYMVDNNPDDLKFLYAKGQEYVKHGGCGIYTYDRWLKQLKRNSNKFLTKED